MASLEEGLKILTQRLQNHDNNNNEKCLSCANENVKLNSALIAPPSTIIPNELSELNNLELVNIFTVLQQERVQTYKSFESALNDLLNSQRIAEYPHLCAESTSIFSVISQKIILIKKLFIERKEVELSTNIIKIQEQEKEKLMLVAAKHLEIVQNKIPEFQGYLGVSMVSQPEYIVEKIEKIEENILELLENITCIKLDLIDKNE